MRILFYVNPFIVRAEPNFYHGAIKHKLFNEAIILRSEGHSVSFLTSEFDNTLYPALANEFNCQTISQFEIFTIFKSTKNIEKLLYYKDINTMKAMALLVSSKFESDFDLIFAWETPADFLKLIWSDALIVNQMPGFLSRVPFPELYTIDPFGLFRDSMVAVHANWLKTTKPDNRALNVIYEIRKELGSFIRRNTPFPRSFLDPRGNYRKLILLPLQVSDQYAFQADSGYDSQMALLIDVLSLVPHDIGVVVTQYVSASASDRVLNAQKHHVLRKIYPNLIYFEQFDTLDNCSQYILPSVDAVVSFSSSIGVQSLLWQKPFIALPGSHFSGIADYTSIDDFIANSDEPFITNPCADYAIANIISYNQPIASLVRRDGKFLTRWIEKVKACDAQIAELPSFFDLVEDYSSAFIGSFNLGRARELLSKANDSRWNPSFSEKMTRLLAETRPKLITFDIFDTLVDRVVEQPVHVFKFIESEVAVLSSGKISNFAIVRQEAERELRAQIASGGDRQEISLDEIYENLLTRFHLSEEEVDSIKSLEVREELKFLCQRAVGHELYKIAVASGARIALVSDMYLPIEVIREIVTGCGYPEDIKIYLSSSIGLRKHEGELFEHVQREEGVSYSDWVHVGDNPAGDVAVPKRFGIRSLHIPSAFRVIEKARIHTNVIGASRRRRTLGESAIYGLIQRRFFDDPQRVVPRDTLFGGDAFMLGYAGVGPVFFGFLRWVMDRAKQDGVTRLLYLSRDGKILWRMAEILFPEKEGWPSSRYVMSSRRAARVASLRTKGDIAQILDSSLQKTTLSTLFLEKLGIEITEEDEHLARQAGLQSVEAIVSVEVREAVKKFGELLSDRILANASDERILLSNYYKEAMLGEKVAVVDIGYAGTMQAAVENITGYDGLLGYYYVTFETAFDQVAKTGPMRGYVGEYLKRESHPDPICSNGFLFETVFCSSDHSFTRFRRNAGGKVVSEYKFIENDSVRRNLIDSIHDGSIALAADLREHFSHRVDLLILAAHVSSAILADMIRQPSGRDAGLFEGCIFEDSFSGTRPRYIVPPRAAIARNKDSIRNAIWKEGAAVFGRRSDIFETEASKSARSERTRAANGNDRSEPSRFSKLKGVFANNSDEEPRPRLSNSIFLFLERSLIEVFVRNENKKTKYQKNRYRFFSDSNSSIIRGYWNTIGRQLAYRGM